jgi:hypothetical protein
LLPFFETLDLGDVKLARGFGLNAEDEDEGSEIA